LREKRFRTWQEGFPSGSELDFFSTSDEQSGAEFRLEVLHLLTQSRLRHVQTFCRPRKTALPGDLNEVAELVEFHDH
jgi:hypothetical protein